MTIDGLQDKALQEFLSEAQEILDALNRNLLILDEGRREGGFDPEVLNEAFRAVHSLKGLSGLFGVNRMTSLSHNLENLLDSLRLGRVELTPEALDLLFEAVAVFHRIISHHADSTASDTPSDHELERAVEGLISRLDVVALRSRPQVKEAPFGGWQLDPSVLSVLTEYEEHRLHENIRAGRNLYRVHCAFDLMTIDRGLERLKGELKPLGEVITYLPSTESASENQIELDVILGSSRPLDEVRLAVAPSNAAVTMMPRGEVTTVPVAAPVAPRPSSAEMLVDDGAEVSLKSVSQTVRVDIRKLDTLMNVVGELAIARAGLQSVLDVLKADAKQALLARSMQQELRAFSRRLDELQSGILEVRMVPLGQVFDKLSRVVRKISRDAKKEIRLQISGADTELDKLIVEELSDPLMHVMRNCIDHGIESPTVRAQRGKPEVGTIKVSAQQRGNHVVVTVEDDGAGIDAKKLIDRAVARGLLDPAAAIDLGEREALNLMFLPGVSTKDVADAVSGRGVGMDVVKTNIARLSGLIDVETMLGRGTRLTMTLPITLAIIQALVIRVAGRTYAIPLNSVLESLLATANDIATIERREVMTLRGSTLPLLRLDRLFDLHRAVEEPRRARQFVVVVGLAQHRVGLLVDEMLGRQDIVVKSLGRFLEGLPGVAGATELGGKKTALVLDVAQLVEESFTTRAGEAA